MRNDELVLLAAAPIPAAAGLAVGEEVGDGVVVVSSSSLCNLASSMGRDVHEILFAAMDLTTNTMSVTTAETWSAASTPISTAHRKSPPPARSRSVSAAMC